MASFNDTIIETFRASDGIVGGHWEGKTMVLLHTVGQKSGNEYVYPLVAAPYDGDYLLCGSMGGAPDDPKWVANLEHATGAQTVEIGADTVKADTTVVRPGTDGWDELYTVWKAYWPDAADYETKTDRKFPMIRLHVQG
jgi:deazaflavin-dependent oxidoreductase (nitroreductase family)